ncbi:MAG: sigma 54-interacting transcriptional regulator [Kofleriaceae bacterium]|nr:sigma 54-interacting transcriptional regulator [Kofleriaceae bacterium]
MLTQPTTMQLRVRGLPELCLLILEGDRYHRHVLPATGKITIGRSEDCDIQIDDASVSRQHALLCVALSEMVTLEDLGSANGTRVAETTIVSGDPTVLGPYEILRFGDVNAVLLRLGSNAKTRVFGARTDFQASVTERCTRYTKGDSVFTLFSLSKIEPNQEDDLRTFLVELLGDKDLVTSIENQTCELLVDGPRSISWISDKLGVQKLSADISHAQFPADGNNSSALLRGIRTAAPVSPKPTRNVLQNPDMVKLYALAEKIARGKISVLIQGETGTGKQVLAEYIHNASTRSDEPFIEINCGAIPAELMESELFGHVKGAFTGANKNKMGLLEAADKGSVFLDEIGDMSPDLQTQLLRILEDGELRPIGATKSRKVDIRVIAATHVDLATASQTGAFREDLYYRLSGITLEVPALRHRFDEVVPLMEVFLARYAHENGSRPAQLSPEAKELLTAYTWPGNIRELRNVAERVTLLCETGSIGLQHLPTTRMLATVSVEHPRTTRGNTTQPITQQEIESALTTCNGNQTRAAALLGVSRRTLTKWLTRYDMPRPRKKSSIQ